MVDYIKRFIAQAKGKLSTYLGLLIGSAAEIRENWSGVTDFVKGHPLLQHMANHAFLVLGLLVIYARIRRAMKETP